MRTSDLRGTLSGADKYQKGMLKRSENIVHRLFNRQISRPRPNTHIHQARTLYENIVPSHTIYDVECPDQNFRKFTNDGQFLISFSRNHQDLVVYRHKWLNFCVKGEAADQPLNLPTKAKKFDSYFSHLYTIPLASGAEAICKDFFLSTENGLYGIFATSTIPENSNPASDGAVPGVPSTEKITIFVVSLAEGQITDQRSFQDDFIHLAHNMGVFLYDDLLAILSIRFQCIRILQIRETGRFVDVRTIGTHCWEDDELVLNSQAQEEVSYHKQQASLRKARGLSQHDVSVSASKIAEQGKPWPSLWNVKPQQGQSSSRRERTRRQAHPSAHGLQNNFSNNAGASVHNLVPYENGNHRDSSVDPHANGNGNEAEIHEADLDLQYENYFRGLLATLEVTAVNEIGNHMANDGARPTAPIQGGMSASSRQASSVRFLQEALTTSSGHNHSATGIENPQQNGIGSSAQLSSERTGATLQQPPLRTLELRTAYAPLDSVYPDRRNGSGSTSGASGGGGGGGNYPAGDPSRYGRSSYTSTTSGSSVDRYTSGRGSSSLRHTSTTITSSDSESQSRSDGSHRRDGSFSGGSMSYGNGRAGGNGSVSIQSENGNLVEYVVSSRTRGTGTVVTTTQLTVAEELAALPRSLPSNSSLQGGSERRGFRLRENGGIFPSDGGPGNANGDLHSQEANPGDPNLDDRTLPSRPVERSTTSGNNNNRAGDMNEIGNASPAQGHNNNGNGNRARPPRDGDNGNAAGAGTLHRNRPIADAAAGSNGGGAKVLGGIKQRLLSFIFQGVVNEDISPITKAQRLKRFYYHFQHYVDLVMWKVQFLDRYHLLIKFGSVDGVLQRNSDTSHQTAFLAIFNLETTEMLGFYQNSSEEFLSSFEQFCDHFRVAPRYPLYMNFISSYSNNSHVRDQLRKQRMACSSSKTGNFAQVVKRTLAWVPFNSQCQSPSAYFDQSLFHYDEKLISAIDRHKPCMEHPIKFISRRRPNCLKFKLSPGPEHGANDSRTKRVASFIFHPIFPFAISIQQSYMQPSIINFHFRK